jgi:RNA polymerase sigma-70 factor (ECF subfamily)
MSLARQLADLGGHAPSPGELRAIDQVLATAIAETRARWPTLAALDTEFLAALATRVEGEPDLAAAVTRLALADVYLVAACAHGDRGALAVFEALVRTETARAVARLPKGPAAEDVVQELLVKLLVGTPPKLAAFGGHGALHAWLRVAALRTAISLSRRHQPVPTDDDVLTTIADDGDDQELAFLKSSYRAEFKRAFADALAALPPRSRTLLRLQIIEQLTIEEIGAIYAVSRATAARWLADARGRLVTGTQERLMAALAVDPAELSELMRLAASTLYSTLPRLLRETDSEPICSR